MKWLSRALWVLLILGIIIILRFFVQTINDDLPSFEDLENPKYDEASIVYDTHGVPFGKYYVENREIITFDELSPTIIDALIATEDVRYHRHSGVDLKALFRVAFKTVLMGKESSGGGSTITQQLAKLLFNRPSLAGKSFVERAFTLLQTKVKEWITAIKLERSYTKEEIIAMYLNKFEFINGAHGIQAAAQTYFNADQADLDLGQAALLVGMLKNPSLYNPLRFPENATKRRNVVLNQLKKFKDIDALALDTIMADQVDMSNFIRDSHDKGPAPYFRAELTKWLRNLFKEKGINKEDGSEYNIYTDGLKIHTTIDLTHQAHAEKALVEHMMKLQERYWRVWDGRNPWTYDADENQKKIRRDVLERKIKESDRYLALHNKILGPVKAKVQEKYGELKMSEKVIKGLIDKENKRYSWTGLVDKNIIDREDLKAYQGLVEDPLWAQTKTDFKALQSAYDEEFSTAITMKVFDYGEAGFAEVEMSPRDSVKFHNQHLQASLLSVDPATGAIKAWVGGPGFNYFKYDHVNSRRQVGSTIKPFVYATAISLMGISPCEEYEDIQYTIAPGDANFQVAKEWSPANANEEFTQNKYNLYQGLLYSKNSITVRLVKEMGNVDVIRELLDNAGISKDQTYPNGDYVIPRVPSICLGAMDLTLAEMAGAYTTFANDGIYTEPVFVSRIEDNTGKIIYTSVPESRRAINSFYNGVMLDMLKNNVGGRYGLGVETDIGGKTGTTNDYADGWFMSVTPDLVTGVWVGGDDKWIRFLNLDDGQGFVMARPIVQNYIKSLEADSLADFNSEKSFPVPPDGFLDFIDCAKYKQMSVEEEQIVNKLDQRQDMFESDFEDEFGDLIKEVSMDSIQASEGSSNEEGNGGGG
ncbi:MAG: peptidoglycan glycosyltransferase [Saprospiraceae bacterium]|nr:peptidoglycan glycosyltransferase [Saprospiraceae bacterium]